jgi:hypothetical protein
MTGKGSYIRDNEDDLHAIVLKGDNDEWGKFIWGKGVTMTTERLTHDKDDDVCAMILPGQ